MFVNPVHANTVEGVIQQEMHLTTRGTLPANVTVFTKVTCVKVRYRKKNDGCLLNLSRGRALDRNLGYNSMPRIDKCNLILWDQLLGSGLGLKLDLNLGFCSCILNMDLLPKSQHVAILVYF